jgi:hypothetical protein
MMEEEWRNYMTVSLNVVETKTRLESSFMGHIIADRYGVKGG